MRHASARRAPLRALVLAATVAAGAMNGAQALDCRQPAQPYVPNGAAASDAAMSDALARMEAYQADMNAYLSCIDRTYTSARAEGERIIADWNRSVDQYQQGRYASASR